MLKHKAPKSKQNHKAAKRAPHKAKKAKRHMSTTTTTAADALSTLTASPLLPEETRPFTKRFLPCRTSLHRVNNIGDEERASLFSAQLPHTNASLQKMEHFIMGIQSTLVGHIEQLEQELTPAYKLQQGSESHDITNIPVVKRNKKEAPKFLIERSSRDPNSGMLGGGVVAVLQGGNVFEKAGCNTSVIHGMMPMDRLQHMRADHQTLKEILPTLSEEQKKAGLPFSVAGISLVFHPHNPHHPTTHANWRMFQIHTSALNKDGGNQFEDIYWFGGGSDLTPTYIEQHGPNSIYGEHFHGALKHVLDTNEEHFNKQLKWQQQQQPDGSEAPSLYEHTKSWCDKYFYLPHRNETRGLGGVFYDDFDAQSTGLTQGELFNMVTQLGDSFAASYFPLIVANADKTYTAEEKQFQQLRRGRYVEFNVMYDRGTKFGLAMPSSAHIRTEQILMSLPLTARYEYCHTPEVGSPEANTLQILSNPVNWQ